MSGGAGMLLRKERADIDTQVAEIPVPIRNWFPGVFAVACVVADRSLTDHQQVPVGDPEVTSLYSALV
jgi:hypothetical protein